MKKSDIAVLILIVAVSLVAAYFIGQAVFGGRTSQPVKVETAESISPDVTKPDPAIFNDKAINPSVQIKIGDSSNKQPFGG